MNWSKTIKASLFVIGLAGITTYHMHANSSGASSPKTGAPSENTCTSCHGGSPVTSGTQHARIRFNANFTGNGYLPDSTYTITITYAESGKSRFGFQLTALDNKNLAAGRFTASTRTATFSSSVNGATRYYIEHNSTGSTSIATDSTAWTFEWKAPSSNVGDIQFYLALNAANNNGSSSGDVIYNKKFTISPSTLLPEASGSVISSTICPNTHIQFDASGTNNTTSYSWTFSGGNPSSSNLKNPTVTYNTAGNKIALLRVFNNKGASSIDTVKFTVLDGAIKPNLNIRTPNVVLCLGDTIEFSVGTTQKHTYVWRNGTNGRTNLIDTGGWVGVTATRDNGCSVKSDSVFVVAVPKPKFDVKYGLTSDSICVNENLIILLSNRGFSDSYSITSANGPYFTDSFIVEKIKSGKNQFQYWAKSKIGCVSPPSPTNIFTGIDTPSAPVLIAKTRLNDRILFSWDSTLFALGYEYSINKGVSWQTVSPDSGNRIWINLDSATQTIEMWVKAKTGNFCGYSKIAKTVAKGAGCLEPNWNIQTNRSIFCLDSAITFLVSGLDENRHALTLEGEALMDTIISRKARATKIWKFELSDATQPLCGTFEKSINILVDTAQHLNLNTIPMAGSLICGIQNEATIQLDIENYNNLYQYNAYWQNQSKSLDSQSFLTSKIGKLDVYVTGFTDNNCKLNEDTLTYYIDTFGNATFNVEWVDNRIYRMSAVNLDTNNWIHTWFDSASGKVYNVTNTAKFEIDFDGTIENNAIITHKITSKRFLNKILDTSCVASFTMEFNNSNLGINSVKTAMRKIYPNPISTLKDLMCQGCQQQEKLFVYDSKGKLHFSEITLEQLRNSQLNSGIYWIQLENNRNDMQKLVITN